MGRYERECLDTRNCFAKQENVMMKGVFCTVLTEAYAGNTCPFCKSQRDITKGERYPYDQFYGKQQFV